MKKKKIKLLPPESCPPIMAQAGAGDLYCDRSIEWLTTRNSPIAMSRFRQLQRMWLSKFLALEDPIAAYVDVVSKFQRIEANEVDIEQAKHHINNWIKDEWVQRCIEQFNKEMFAYAVCTREQILARLEWLSRCAKFDADKIKATVKLGEEAFGMWKPDKTPTDGFSLVEILKELGGDTQVRIATTEKLGTTV